MQQKKMDIILLRNLILVKNVSNLFSSEFKLFNYLLIIEYIIMILFNNLFIVERFLYTCKIEFENYSGAEVLELLIAADGLGIESLYEYITKYFIENYDDYIKESPVKILQIDLC